MFFTNEHLQSRFFQVFFQDVTGANEKLSNIVLTEQERIREIYVTNTKLADIDSGLPFVKIFLKVVENGGKNEKSHRIG